MKIRDPLQKTKLQKVREHPTSEGMYDLIFGDF